MTTTTRTFRHELTRETTSLRYHAGIGAVSRPERAGLDVGAHVFVRGASVEQCRQVWAREQSRLISEGFTIAGTSKQ